jgi:hypothetical protein
MTIDGGMTLSYAGVAATTLKGEAVGTTRVIRNPLCLRRLRYCVSVRSRLGFFRVPGGKRGKTRQVKRSRRMGGAGRSDVGRSEELAGLARDGTISPEVDPAAVWPALRDSINRRLDEVIARWNSVPVGGDLVLRWPVHLTIKRRQL